jgi:Holliday junction resolvase
VAPLLPPDLPHLLHEALTQLGWSADAARLAEQLKTLHLGLPREDEFAVVCTWLGRCALIHKLDQVQAPAASSGKYQVPDLLAVFEQDGKVIPVLIEVKSSNKQTLSFRTDYFHRLKSYGDVLNLPVLVAWKHNGLWALFEIDQMAIAQKNFNIAFTKAMTENLLGVLAGDFTYTLPRGTGLHLRFRKDEMISRTQDGDEAQEEWKLTIVDVYYTDREGKERRDITPDIQALFYVNSLEERQEHTSTHIYWHFTVEDDENKFAHMALVALLNWYASNADSLNWREVVARQVPIPAVRNFAETVERALREGVVKYIFYVQPNTWPAFLRASRAV